jgi:hypothetical protein
MKGSLSVISNCRMSCCDSGSLWYFILHDTSANLNFVLSAYPVFYKDIYVDRHFSKSALLLSDGPYIHRDLSQTIHLL